jgi:hypothetical protein
MDNNKRVEVMFFDNGKFYENEGIANPRKIFVVVV